MRSSFWSYLGLILASLILGLAIIKQTGLIINELNALKASRELHNKVARASKTVSFNSS